MVRRPIVMVLGVGLIALGSVTSFLRMPIDLFPDLNYPLINVVTQYPAGTAEDMETLITRPIETAVRSLPGLQRLRSTSTAGFSQVTVEFIWGTSALNARELVLSALGQASAALPSGARPELENVGSSLAMVSSYTLVGGDSPAALRDWADYVLGPALGALPGIAEVQVFGGERAALRVDLDPGRLRQLGLGAAQIVQAIRDANVLGTGGFIEAHGRDILVESRGQLRSLDDLATVQIGRDEERRPLLLKDVATLYVGGLPERYVVTVDHAPAVAFTIRKQPDASTLDVSRAVEARLETLKPPEGARIEKFYDQADIIGLAYRNMRDQLLIGGALAVITLFWALGRSRAALAVAVSVPLSVFATFLLMDWAGFGLNLMTLGALTITIGMIDDDAVLVIENIFRHRQMGKPSFQATIDGTSEIIGADVAGTLTTVAAFAPLVLLSGLPGRMFLPFGLTFGFVLLLSLLFSLSILPWVTARWLPSPEHGFDLSKTTSGRFFQWIARINRGLLEVLLRRRWLTIAGAVVILAGMSGLVTLNPVRFLPLLDEDSLLLSYQLAPGTALSESDRIGHELEALVLAEPGVKGVFRRTGSPAGTFFIEGPDQGEITIRLDHQAGRTAQQVKTSVEAKVAGIPGLVTRLNEPTSEKLDESFSGLPAMFGITVFADRLDELYDAARRVEDIARKTEGIDKVVNNTKIPVESLVVEIDRAACARLGVAPLRVQEAVEIAIQGVEAVETLVDGRVIRVFVRYAAAAGEPLDKLRHVVVAGPDGALIPLPQLATIKPALAYPTIEHLWGSRSLTLTAEVEGSPFAVMPRLDRAVAGLKLPEGIRVSYVGQYRELSHTVMQSIWILLGAAALVYAIMVVQLRSLLDAAIVLVKLPIDFAGAALALYVTHQTLDLTVVLGFITLVGVAMNNGIVLLSFATQLRKEGLDAVSAIHKAVEVRIRPMLLSYLTTVLALIPAAIGIGSGPQLLQPLGIMLFGGLSLGVVMTLNLIPVVYVATERWRGQPRLEGPAIR